MTIINYLKKKIEWILLLIFFIFITIESNYHDEKEVSDICSNIGFTVAMTVGEEYGQGCFMEFIYEIIYPPPRYYYDYDRYFRKSMTCFTNQESCKKFLLAYSKKEPEKSVMILDFPLRDTVAFGSDLHYYIDSVSIDLLKYWKSYQTGYFPTKYIRISQEKFFNLMSKCK